MDELKAFGGDSASPFSSASASASASASPAAASSSFAGSGSAPASASGPAGPAAEAKGEKKADAAASKDKFGVLFLRRCMLASIRPLLPTCFSLICALLVLVRARARPVMDIEGVSEEDLKRNPVIDRILGTIYGPPLCLIAAIAFVCVHCIRAALHVLVRRSSITGNCLGDAVGLATEFMSKREGEGALQAWHSSESGAVLAAYGDTPIPFPRFKRNGHNSRWAEGDW